MKQTTDKHLNVSPHGTGPKSKSPSTAGQQYTTNNT